MKRKQQHLQVYLKAIRQGQEGRKLKRMIAFLTESHLDSNGGYPYDFKWIGDTLAVASLDHDEATQLKTYERDALIAWHDRAVAYLKEDPEETWATACWETMEEE